jgi:riboflavin kinase/FMN adenylyltransferase
LRGTVEVGDQRGRTLGYPTANVNVDHVDLEEGVWAGTLCVENDVPRLAAVSIGRRETIYGRAGFLLAEVFVLDFFGDLYGQTVTISLDRWIRRQRHFASLPALVTQIERDVAACRRWAESRGDLGIPEVDSDEDVTQSRSCATG